MKRTIARIVKFVFSKLGFEVYRKNKNSKETDFYLFHESCQIPLLSSLYVHVFGEARDGVVVEVGAYDGKTFSNSLGLINAGWTGLLVEPIPKFANLCRKLFKGNPNVRVVERAVSAKSGFGEIRISGPLSTMSSQLNSEYKNLDWARKTVGRDVIRVETTTLNELLEAESIKESFDLLLVDVEGFEEEVFAGFDLQKWKPKAMIIELSDFHPDLISGRKSHFNLGQRILNQSYSIIYKDAINTFFVRNDVISDIFERYDS
jgi:FkbM family methyltransferase